jgi:Histidine kinase-, DNA gyrase B-, and HSP90-like ATPase
MTKVKVTAKPDHIKSLSSARPIDALAELIWNGFDSGSNKVVVTTTQNQMGALDTIKVRDSGSGINFNKIDSLFGGLGDSWKKSQGKQNGRALHGKNGKGRFKAFSLGQFVEWTSTFAEGGKKFKFKLTCNAASLDGFEITNEPSLVGNWHSPKSLDILITQFDAGARIHGG